MSQRGFTLIEMSFVIILIGLIVSGGLFAFTPMLQKARINQTNASLDQVESALELFVIRNSRLPCPADGSITINGANKANYGIELGGGANGSCTAALANSVIPWKTLGLDEAYSLDGWATRLSYWPSGVLATSNSLTGSTTMIRAGTVYPTGPFLTLTDVVSSQIVTPPSVNDEAAYVLVSHGRSQWYGWNKVGVQIQPTLTEADKACNSDPTNAACAFSGTFTSGGPVGTYPPLANTTYFDDIVRWRSPAMIIQLCGSGSCGNP